VHFHDIFLPWEYPREWLVGLGYYWSEQYLLLAFLSFNAAYEVLLAAHHLSRALRNSRPSCRASMDHQRRDPSGCAVAKK